MPHPPDVHAPARQAPAEPTTAQLAAQIAALLHENAVLTRHLATAQARCTAGGSLASRPQPAAPTSTPQRRRLHQLPASAQDLLLALSLPPPALRAEIERALSRQRGQPVQLQGSDADVLYSALHDLGSRNALSDALHRRLDTRHAAAVQRLARLRDPQALRQAWLHTLQHACRPQDDVPAQLWALLTHPLGRDQEVQALAEARGWLHEQARRGLQADQGQASAAQALARLTAEVQALQLRLQQQQQQLHQARQQAELQAATLAGERQRWRAVAESRPAAAPPPAPTDAEPAVPTLSPAPRPVATTRALAAAPASAPPRRPATATATAAVAAVAPASSPVAGQRVLCVGGIQRAVARYRSRIEDLGGCFEHHDGGLHDNPHVLDGRLARADLVICQAGCVQHAAYHRIKLHCQRTGTPCLYLERASLARFDRALQDLALAAAPQTTKGPLARALV